MTLHTYTTYRCDCGHIGAVHTKENDQPYSTNWESVSMEGLTGTEQSPGCQACGTSLEKRHEIPGRPQDYPKA